MKRKCLISVAMFLFCGLQLNAYADDMATDLALGIPFLLEDLSGQVDGIRTEQQKTETTLDSFNETLGALRDICYAPPVCAKTCEDGVQKIYLTQVDERGIAVCPSEPAFAVPCYPYECGDNGECKNECTNNDACRPGFACCKAGAAGCDDALFLTCVPDVLHCLTNRLALISPDGQTVVGCTPYACTGSTCLTHCTSTADCAVGYLCGAAGDCVLPAQPDD